MEEQQSISWNSYYFVQKASLDLNYGDKIKLPAIALEQLLAKAGHSTLPSPLTFELRHPHSGAFIHCGVKEFASSSSDSAELPEWIMTALGLKAGDRVLIKLQLLPKGTWTQLKPLSDNYQDITDYRAALEAHLRGHYNTLTKGQVLFCRYGEQTYPFQVTELKPQEAVLINDTDLEVDIEGSANIGHQQSDHTKSEVGLNESVLSADVPYKDYRYWSLKLRQNTNVELKLTVEKGDIDIVISSKTKHPKVENYEWADLSSDNERLLRLMNIQANILYVGIHGYEESSVTTWEVKEIDEAMADTKMEEPEDDKEGKVQCKNCHAWIMERTVMLHEGFCYRNNAVCPWGCGKVFKKGSEELEKHWHCDQCDAIGSIDGKKKHVEYYHTPKMCVCNTFTTDSYESLAEHKCTDCSEKMIICKYCHTLVAQGVVSLDPRDRLLGLRSHESYCGSRTITCQKCSKPIPIKDIQVHAKVHEIKRQQQTLPPACSNMNCTRPRAKNRLSLCQYCFGPFWMSEDDPKNTKLVQKVARKLHAQLTEGCGKKWCQNKYCATSTNDKRDATTAASLLIPMIKNLPRELNKPNPNPELYFCVDESISQKKFLADVLYNEAEDKYELGWCVKAVESEQGDLDRAKIWLDRNAPRKNHLL